MHFFPFPCYFLRFFFWLKNYPQCILLKAPEWDTIHQFRILLLRIKIMWQILSAVSAITNLVNNNVFPTFTMTSVRCDRGCYFFRTLPPLYAAVLFHKHTQTGRTKHLAPYSSSLTAPQPQPSLSIPSLISNRVNKTTAANRSAKQRTPHTHTHRQSPFSLVK
jgi:hypothetical protein